MVEEVRFLLLSVLFFLFQIKLLSTIELCNFDFQNTSNNMKRIVTVFKLAYLIRGYYLMFPETHFVFGCWGLMG